MFQKVQENNQIQERERDINIERPIVFENFGSSLEVLAMQNHNIRIHCLWMRTTRMIQTLPTAVSTTFGGTVTCFLHQVLLSLQLLRGRGRCSSDRERSVDGL